MWFLICSIFDLGFTSFINLYILINHTSVHTVYLLEFLYIVVVSL